MVFHRAVSQINRPTLKNCVNSNKKWKCASICEKKCNDIFRELDQIERVDYNIINHYSLVRLCLQQSLEKFIMFEKRISTTCASVMVQAQRGPIKCGDRTPLSLNHTATLKCFYNICHSCAKRCFSCCKKEGPTRTGMLHCEALITKLGGSLDLQ